MTDRALVLMYHNIGIPPKGARLRSLYVLPRMFRFQMWYLKAAGFRVAPLGEVLGVINGSACDEKLVALTFDDGFMDFYENAFPVLREHDYPSTVFIVSDMAGKENLWDYKETGVKKQLLDWGRITEMKDKGVSFGSHTKTHPFLSRLSEKEMTEEIGGSKRGIEERLNLPVEFFCYPYGDYNAKVLDSVKKAGYSAAFTTKRGFVHQGDDPFELRRSFIRLNTHPLLFMYKLHSGYEDKKGLRT